METKRSKLSKKCKVNVIKEAIVIPIYQLEIDKSMESDPFDLLEVFNREGDLYQYKNFVYKWINAWLKDVCMYIEYVNKQY